MLELEEALARVLDAIPPVVHEQIPISAADGRFLVGRVEAAVDLPVFDNSSMDGYAVRAADLAPARREAPIRLCLAGRTAAGETFPDQLAPGACVRLFTGSPLPSGADAVVRQEDTSLDPDLPEEVLFMHNPKPWENVRLRGEDVKQGEVVGEAGKLIGTGCLSLLAAAGQASVHVGRRPVVGLLATGSELREPGEPLAPGQIYESNRLPLAALTRKIGAIPRILSLVPDALTPTLAALKEAFDRCDCVVSSGGVSVGEMDFIKQAFTEAGGELQFWKVAIKPGRPFVFGCRQGKVWFGLPGNPVSAMVTFLLLVRPALLRWQGAKDLSLPTQTGLLAARLDNPGARRHFVRVKLDTAGRVHSAGLQASHALRSLAEANGLVDVPPQKALPPGTTVQVLKWE